MTESDKSTANPPRAAAAAPSPSLRRNPVRKQLERQMARTLSLPAGLSRKAINDGL